MSTRCDDFNNDWERSETESCGSSCSGSENECTSLPWLEKVGSKGDLFYIEQNFSFHAETSSSVVTDDSNKECSNYNSSTLSAKEKLKKWMKKRKHKLRKPFETGETKYKKYNEIVCRDEPLSPQNYTFKDVFVEVNTSRKTLGRRVTLAGELLGLELELLEELHNADVANKVKVVGFTNSREIPGIKLGDLLYSINDETVYISNIDDILKKLDLPTKVKLTLLIPFSGPKADSFTSKHSHIVDELLGNSDIIKETKVLFNNVLHGVIFLKMLDDTAKEDTILNEGVIYKYPDESTALCVLKGMFLTLSHVIPDVASPPILSCCLDIQGQTVHVGFLKEKDAILLLAVPAICAAGKEVQYFVKNLEKLLKYQFSSLEIAFSTENHKQIDKIFAMFFKHFLSEQSENVYLSPPHLFEILPSAHWLPLSSELKTEIDDILNELESSDFGSSSEGFYENQRIYSIIGSSLFYKGYLISSHLPKSDLLDLHLFLLYSHILTLIKIEPVSELIVWKEVFPSRHSDIHYESSKFEEVQGRYFLLVIAMNSSLLAVILEAGGCTILPETYPPPEPFYVEEVQNTLIILHSYGIISAIQKSLQVCLHTLASPDLYLKGDSTSRNSSSTKFSPTHNTTTKSTEDISFPNSLSFDKGFTYGESDLESDYSDTSNESFPFPSKKFGNVNMPPGSSLEFHENSDYMDQMCSSSSSIFDLNTSNSSFENICSITVGSNTVFQYLHMDPVEGVFLAPILEECDIHHGSAYNDILLNFHRCSLNMRSVFARSLRNEEILSSNTVTKFGVNNFLYSAYEQGVLFCYTSKDNSKQRNSLNFWIIGRLFFAPEPREVYVCYHDSTQQDIVELAFKLGFGLSL